MLINIISVFGQSTKTEALNQKGIALQSILDKTVDGKKIFGASFAIKQDGYTWSSVSGNIKIDEPYFIASTTKLFTTAIILKLRAQSKLNLEDKISKFLNDSIVRGLHIYKGVDYSNEICIAHLLSHTSGLPDYFQNKGPNGISLEDELIAGNDQFWTFEQCIVRTKNIKPFFKPGAKGKAHYSDANFQLLGRIIEQVTGKSYNENVIEMIIEPLAMKSTYLYNNPQDAKPKALFYKSNILNLPKAMCSFGPDGGMVSNNKDMLIFVEAFFTGKLFPLAYIDEIQKWNPIFFPMQAGLGLHLFKLPKIFNPTGSIPYFIGHSGLSGALAFYCPKENIFIVGTVNQVANPDVSFKTMIKLVMTILKK